jgi:predicted CXXCH cytochrome family protein
LFMEEGDCLSCHVSHFSEFASLLNDRDPSLCTKCHSSDTDVILQAHIGLSLQEIRSCTSCHESHVTELPGLIKEISHDPFEKRDCEACHV